MTSNNNLEAQHLSTAPFDLEFFGSVLKQVFSKREMLERVLRGERVESATDVNV